jgi:hypothetical protein
MLSPTTECSEIVQNLQSFETPKGINIIPHVVAFTNNNNKLSWIGDEFTNKDRSFYITFSSVLRNVRVDGKYNVFWFEQLIGPQNGKHGIANDQVFAHAMILIIQQTGAEDNCYIYDPSYCPKPARLPYLTPLGIRTFVKKLPKSFKLFFSSSAVNEQMCRPLCMKFIEGFLDNQMILAEFSLLLR